MDNRKIGSARLALQQAGTLADRNQLRATLIAQLENDAATLKAAKATVRADYRRRLERWRTEEIPEDVPVCALPSDVHDSRLYRRTGLFALLSEMALAAWIFSWLGVAWWIGALAGLGITLTLHGIFLHVFDNAERPKEAIFRIRRCVSLPAVVGFLGAFALGVLARYVRGELAVILLPVFSLALWLGTLSLVILAASLFTISHIQGWSASHARQYRKLDQEERATSAFLDQLRSDGHGTRVIADHPGRLIDAGETSEASNPAAKSAAGLVAMAVVTLGLISGGMTGCSTAQTAANRIEVDTSTAPRPATLQVFMDTSGSCVRPALAESWDTVRQELPDIIERGGIGTLTAWRFDVDGWSPWRLTQIALPIRRRSKRPEAVSTEWATFSNIRNAVREVDDREWFRQEAAAEERYRQSLAQALQALAGPPPLPEVNHKSAGTDIVGLLRRISETNERERQYVIILTDLADTRYRVIPKLAPPRVDVRVLVLLSPAQPKDARLTLGRALSGPEQFDLRTRQLRASAPWVAVAPYFARSLAQLFPTPGNVEGSGEAREPAARPEVQ